MFRWTEGNSSYSSLVVALACKGIVCIYTRIKKDVQKPIVWKFQLISFINPPTAEAELLWQVATVVEINQPLNQLCTQNNFLLALTVILTTLNNTRQCFYQSKNGQLNFDLTVFDF